MNHSLYPYLYGTAHCQHEHVIHSNRKNKDPRTMEISFPISGNNGSARTIFFCLSNQLATFGVI